MTEGAVRVAVHRLRHRYGELLRHEIAQTVSGPEEIEEETRYLLKALNQ
jgi:RNA polymerase sigma-70 factor (ECF subfamily)